MLEVHGVVDSKSPGPAAVPTVRGASEMIAFVDRPVEAEPYFTKNAEFYRCLKETLDNGRAIVCTIQQYRCAQSKYRSCSGFILRSAAIDGGQGGYTVWLEHRAKVMP